LQIVRFSGVRGIFTIGFYTPDSIHRTKTLACLRGAVLRLVKSLPQAPHVFLGAVQLVLRVRLALFSLAEASSGSGSGSDGDSRQRPAQQPEQRRQNALASTRHGGTGARMVSRMSSRAQRRGLLVTVRLSSPTVRCRLSAHPFHDLSLQGRRLRRLRLREHRQRFVRREQRPCSCGAWLCLPAHGRSDSLPR
jgi:hypothetical protein